MSAVRLTDAQIEALRDIDVGRAWKVTKLGGAIKCFVERDGETRVLREPTARALFMRDLIEPDFTRTFGSSGIPLVVTDDGRAALAAVSGGDETEAGR